MKGASLEAMSNRSNRFPRNAFGNSVSNAETVLPDFIHQNKTNNNNYKISHFLD